MTSKLVPGEPTEEIIGAMAAMIDVCLGNGTITKEIARLTYYAALAAAPEQPSRDSRVVPVEPTEEMVKALIATLMHQWPWFANQFQGAISEVPPEPFSFALTAAIIATPKTQNLPQTMNTTTAPEQPSRDAALDKRIADALEASLQLWDLDSRLWPAADKVLKPLIAELRALKAQPAETGIFDDIYEALHKAECDGFTIPPSVDAWWKKQTDLMMYAYEKTREQPAETAAALYGPTKQRPDGTLYREGVSTGAQPATNIEMPDFDSIASEPAPADVKE